MNELSIVGKDYHNEQHVSDSSAYRPGRPH